MAVRLDALCLDAHDPEDLARFWAGVLGREPGRDEYDVPTLPPDSAPGFPLRFLPGSGEKAGPNQAHFDLTSASASDQGAIVARALELGARRLDVGQGPDAEHVVLADPDGNEFCVIEPGNGFLADTGVIGALSSDGTQRVGYFWSEALGWPLVWDQDEETAIQAPDGGTKITWGGPPLNPRWGKNRLHLDLAVEPGGDPDAEVERLVGLGATVSDVAQAHPARVRVVGLADPDGNEFCLLPPR